MPRIKIWVQKIDLKFVSTEICTKCCNKDADFESLLAARCRVGIFPCDRVLGSQDAVMTSAIFLVKTVERDRCTVCVCVVSVYVELVYVCFFVLSVSCSCLCATFCVWGV